MKKYYIILFCVQVMVAIGAIPAGYAYVTDPSGASMGVTIELLAKSPFRDFLIPGLFLLIIHGFFNLVAAVFSVLGKPVSGKIALLLGFILVVWIIIQVAWIGLSSFLQPVMLGAGLLEMALGWTIIRKSKPGY